MKASRFEEMVATAFRLYPLANGCGTIANSRLARLLVPNSKRAVLGKVGGLACYVPLDDLVGRSIFLVGELDRKVGRIIKKYVKQGDTVLDVGANLGLVSLQLANSGAARILAFEPNPRVLEYLEKTLLLNPEAPIELHRCALGNEDGELLLSVPSGNAGKATVKRDPHFEAVQTSVPVLRLADVLARNDVSSVDFMKLDVEGFEAEVLAGLFSGHVRPKYILFEENAVAKSKSIRLLSDAGYTIRGISAPNHTRVKEIPQSSASFGKCHDFLAIHCQ